MRTSAVLCLFAVTLGLGPISAGPMAQQRGVAAVDTTGGRRLALVIGNQAYPQAPLLNPVADAKSMSQALQRSGFAVTVALDTDLRELTRQIDRFVAQLHPGDVALVFYSGHGIQIDGENYFLPVDFTLKDEADAKYQSYSANRIIDRLNASGARLSMLILDACRTNPFRSSRSGTRGLATMDSGRGTLIAFATAPNDTADDNPLGANGLFTTYVLEAMNEPGMPLELVFSHARQKVYEASAGRQVPWLVSSVIGDFFFRLPANAEKLNVPTPSIPAPVSAGRFFARGASGVELSQIKPDKARDFEATFDRAKDALNRSPNPQRKQQTAGWKLFRGIEPGTSSSVLYVSVMDPTVEGADYSVGAILAEGFPGGEVQRLYKTYSDAFQTLSQNVLNLRLLMDMRPASPPPPRAPGQRPVPAPSIQTVTGDAALVFNFIKPERTADFELAMEKIRSALAASSDPTRRAQASGWKVYRAAESGGSNTLYIFKLDPAVKGADYAVSTLLAEGYPVAELNEIYKKYFDSYAQAQTWLNLRLVANLSTP